MNIQFGRDQLKNPTPANFAFWMKVFTVASAAIMGWMPTVKWIPHSFQDIATPILALLVVLGNSLLPLFGVEIQGKNVPKEDVAVVEATTNK